MTEEGYALDNCILLLGAVIRQEIYDVRGDPYRLKRLADWLGMSPEEMLRLWKISDRRRTRHGIRRSDFHGQQ